MATTMRFLGREGICAKKVMSIKMDSRTPQEPKPDAEKNLAIQLLQLIAPADVAKEHEDRLRAAAWVWRFEEGRVDNYWNYFAKGSRASRRIASQSDYVHKC